MSEYYENKVAVVTGAAEIRKRAQRSIATTKEDKTHAKTQRRKGKTKTEKAGIHHRDTKNTKLSKQRLYQNLFSVLPLRLCAFA
jgi:hypothetical protein